MTMKSNQGAVRLPQAVILAIAGVLAFLAATMFAPRIQAPVEVVAAEIRQAAPAPSGFRAERTALPSAPGGVPALERLARSSEHNPFAPLNLQPPAMATLGTPKDAATKPVAATKPKAPIAADSVAPETAPTAPPLPFKAFGSIQGAEVTNGKQVAFLQQQDRILVVSAGASIDGVYRVEAITNARIDFTYLPLGQLQVLTLVP